MRKTTYGAAFLAAPLFSFIYAFSFQNMHSNIFWLFEDLNSFFFLIVFYPIIEELTFRGLIQEYISYKTKQKYFFLSLSFSNIITSFLFVSIHFFYHTPLWAFLVFFPSLVFGYFKDQTSSVLPSIALHMFYNLCFFSFVTH